MRSHLGPALALLVAACGSDPTTPSPTMMTGPAPITVTTPPFTVAAGGESTKCYYTSLPSDKDIAMVKLSSHMTPGSHHMIVYYTSKPEAPDGTLDDCDLLGAGEKNYDFPIPLYLVQEADAELDMPPKVSLSLKAHQALIFQMHYLNATEKDLSASVTWNVQPTDDTSFTQAAPFFSYNTKIAIPPGGEQTVSGTCDVPGEAQFFIMSTHSHLHTVEDIVARYANGKVGDTLVDTTDWSHPPVVQWQAPYLTFQPDEQLYYQCHYKNDGSTTVYEGESARTNEMCMAVGYYFPGSKVTACIDSMSYTF